MFTRAVAARWVQPRLRVVRWRRREAEGAHPPPAAADAPGAAHETLPPLVAPNGTAAALGSIAAADTLNLINKSKYHIYTRL